MLSTTNLGKGNSSENFDLKSNNQSSTHLKLNNKKV